MRGRKKLRMEHGKISIDGDRKLDSALREYMDGFSCRLARYKRRSKVFRPGPG